jgi:hypothetical protein
MKSAQHYRDQAARARRLAPELSETRAADLLTEIAQEYDELAVHFETGETGVHKELTPQERQELTP